MVKWCGHRQTPVSGGLGGGSSAVDVPTRLALEAHVGSQAIWVAEPFATVRTAETTPICNHKSIYHSLKSKRESE